MPDGAADQGDWAGAWLAAFEAWAGPLAEPAAARETRALRLSVWRVERGTLFGLVGDLSSAPPAAACRIRVPPLPEDIVEAALDDLDVRVTDLHGPRGAPLRAALQAKVVAATGGAGLVPHSFQADCTCRAAADGPCIHVRAASRHFAGEVRANPLELLLLHAGTLWRLHGKYLRPRHWSAPPAALASAEPAVAVGTFWLGTELASDGCWRPAGRPPEQGVAARADLPLRVAPPPWGGSPPGVVERAMATLCEALASVDDGRNIEADIASVHCGWVGASDAPSAGGVGATTPRDGG